MNNPGTDCFAQERAGESISSDNALTPREAEVVTHLVDGYSNKEIATAMGISARTVQQHIAQAIRKTNSRNRTQLAVFAVRTGLVIANEECAPEAEPRNEQE